MKQLSLLLLAVIALGCGPSEADVVAEYLPQYEAFRAELRALAGNLPDSLAQGCTTPLDPPPAYPPYNTSITNTDILTYEQLLHPIAEEAPKPLPPIQLSKFVRIYLGFFEPEPELPNYWKHELETNAFAEALAVRYLGIARITDYVPPTVTASESELERTLFFKSPYEGGTAEVHGYLYDREAKAFVCSFSITTDVGDKWLISEREGETKAEALKRSLDSFLTIRTEHGFLEHFEALTGVPFSKEGLF